MTLRRFLFPLALACAALLVPSSAGAYVYWASSMHPEETPTVGRANLDGTNVIPALINDDVSGLAANSTNLYFLSQTPGGEEEGGYPVNVRTDLDGAERLEMPGLELFHDTIEAADSGHIYWASATGLGRAKLDGGDPEPEYLTGLEGFGQKFAVYENYVYWTVESLGVGCIIGRANLVTKVAEPEFVPDCSGPESEGPIGIAVDAAGIFWTSISSPGFIGHVGLNGGGLAVDYIPGSKAFGGPIAIVGVELYWASDESIGHAHLVGGGASVLNTQFIPGDPGDLVRDLAVNSASSPAVPGPPPPPALPQPAPIAPPKSSPPSAKSPAMLPVPKVRLNTKAGLATLTLTAPGPGEVVLSGAGIVRRRKTVKRAGPVAVTVRPTAKVAKKLKQDGKVKLAARLSFTPLGGDPSSRVVKLTLKLSP